MAYLRQKKKQNPAKRAWRSFTNMVKSKFRDIEIASTVRDSTTRVLRFLSRRLIVPFRTRYLQNTSYSDRYYGRNQTSSRRFFDFFSRSPRKTKGHRYGYDDDYSEFYQYQSQSHSERKRESSQSREKVVVGRKYEKEEKEKEEEEEEGMPEIADSMEDAWRRVVAASPHLRVNERADEFIYKFKESIKMEKERSFLEFQDRLKRSA